MTSREGKVGADQLERLVLTTALGLLTALESNLISIVEAEQLLFSPHTMALLRRRGARAELIALIHAGTELEDLMGRLPGAYKRSLADMRVTTNDLLQNGSPHDFQQAKWLSLLE